MNLRSRKVQFAGAGLSLALSVFAMRYERIEELPVHCRINLPEAAQHVYREAWNRAWESSADLRLARDRAWREVREQFERDAVTGCWMRRATPMVLRAVSDEAAVAVSAI
ncbi:MAG TPA: ChaB family protein [Thermoanaerobaculia bacterium]|nr:ChaB family protein [Thermoanaerobaculia bacterium]